MFIITVIMLLLLAFVLLWGSAVVAVVVRRPFECFSVCVRVWATKTNTARRRRSKSVQAPQQHQQRTNRKATVTRVKNSKNGRKEQKTTRKKDVAFEFESVVCRMPVVLLLLFQVVAGIALVIFLLHYLCYIVNAIIRDFCETLITTREFLQRFDSDHRLSAASFHTNSLPLASSSYSSSPVSVSSWSSSLSCEEFSHRNLSKIPIKIKKAMQTSDDAKFIKKWVCVQKKTSWISCFLPALKQVWWFFTCRALCKT